MIMTDASDTQVLAVFPFGNIDDAPDDYEVEDWATGLLVQGSCAPVGAQASKLGVRLMINGSLQGQPALARYEGEQVCELLVIG